MEPGYDENDLEFGAVDDAVIVLRVVCGRIGVIATWCRRGVDEIDLPTFAFR